MRTAIPFPQIIPLYLTLSPLQPLKAFLNRIYAASQFLRNTAQSLPTKNRCRITQRQKYGLFPTPAINLSNGRMKKGAYFQPTILIRFPLPETRTFGRSLNGHPVVSHSRTPLAAKPSRTNPFTKKENARN
ncbi:hypothetical protein Barb7_00457 [Bacteroidales bacterium Barb7]|nr:hypothetical protein Barb7_00457 [Bacteroidales bacterium Barb7]